MSDRAADRRCVLELLRAAGWSPERSVASQVEEWSRTLDRPGGFQMSDPAREALTEFGGLRAGVSGPGVDFATSSVQLDPTLALGEEDRFARHEAELETTLYPLGEVDHGHSFLAIDPAGRVYVLMDSCQLLAPSLLEGLESLLLGLRRRLPAL